MRRPRVLVTDAEHRSVVAAVRGLLLAGYDVTAAASKSPAPGQWQRGAKRLRLPDPGAEPAAFVDAVASLLESSPHELLLPGIEASILAVSEQRERLDGLTRHGLPPKDVVKLSFDKLALLDRAAAHGLAAPESVVCMDSEALEAATEQLGLPLMLKPQRSLVNGGRRPRHESARLVQTEDELREATDVFGFPVCAQRTEIGAPVYSFAGVAGEERLLALVFARYERTWPPEAGNASFAETCVPPPELVERVAALLSDLGWRGIFELELLALGDDRYAAIDFNPRVYGSLALAVRAGANFPAIWCAWLSEGTAPAATVVAKPGFRYRLEEAEMRNAISLLKHARLGSAAGVLRPRRHVAHAYFRWNDPGPLVARVAEIAAKQRSSGAPR
jgi:predicted ATP-grasp superfamily ATP-dependent carboligase